MAKKASPIIRAIQRALPSVVSLRMTSPEGSSEYAVSHDDAVFEQSESQIGGSGFFVSPNGILVTNRHVVPDPHASYEAILQNGNAEPAQLLAYDPTADIAFLKINKRNLKPLRLGSARTLKLGEAVVAIGNAFGQFANTVSSGIISGLSRSLIASLDQKGSVEELEGLIQTDAAINPGNSGGPLMNLKGEVVGINIATVMGAQSLGFAIPIDIVKRDLEDLNRYKRIRRGYIGIRYIPINELIAKELKLNVAQGALIASDAAIPAVEPKSPAEKAGLRINDIVLAVNGKAISDKLPLSAILAQVRVGRPLTFTVLRAKKRRRIAITPVEWENPNPSSAPYTEERE